MSRPDPAPRLGNVEDITDWSVSRKTKRLAYLTEKDSISVIDCTNGKAPFTVGSARLARLLGIDFAIPCRLAIAPDDGRLIVCTFSTFYGRNGYILGRRQGDGSLVVEMTPVPLSTFVPLSTLWPRVTA